MVKLTETSDWIGSIRKTQDDPMVWEGECRFRYYATTLSDEDSREHQIRDAHSGQDRKNFYEFKTKPGQVTTIERAQEVMRGMAQALVDAGALWMDEILHHGDHEDFLCRFTERPWAHAKAVPTEGPEFERLLLESRALSRAERRELERKAKKRR